jgi:MSHA biogenesis protein MshP
MSRRRQAGVALFTAIFLIVVIAVVATSVALVTTTQQVASGRSLDATRAYYAARARLEREIAVVVATTGSGNDCPDQGQPSAAVIEDFETRLVACTAVEIAEGGDNYDIFTLRVAAFRGSRDAGTLVRREVQAVVTNQD